MLCSHGRCAMSRQVTRSFCRGYARGSHLMIVIPSNRPTCRCWSDYCYPLVVYISRNLLFSTEANTRAATSDDTLGWSIFNKVSQGSPGCKGQRTTSLLAGACLHQDRTGSCRMTVARHTELELSRNPRRCHWESANPLFSMIYKFPWFASNWTCMRLPGQTLDNLIAIMTNRVWAVINAFFYAGVLN